MVWEILVFLTARRCSFVKQMWKRRRCEPSLNRFMQNSLSSAMAEVNVR